jgi:hypothetical protein
MDLDPFIAKLVLASAVAALGALVQSAVEPSDDHVRSSMHTRAHAIWHSASVDFGTPGRARRSGERRGSQEFSRQGKAARGTGVWA